VFHLLIVWFVAIPQKNTNIRMSLVFTRDESVAICRISDAPHIPPSHTLIRAGLSFEEFVFDHEEHLWIAAHHGDFGGFVQTGKQLLEDQ
jgi:hypothetical protein